VLLSSEPYLFRDVHVAELRAEPLLRDKSIALVDGEMTTWYGSRAIEGLGYLGDSANSSIARRLASSGRRGSQGRTLA